MSNIETITETEIDESNIDRTMNFDTLTVAYEDLSATVVRLGQFKNHIDQDFNMENDKWFHNPLEYGPRRAVESAMHDCKEDFVKFIIRQLSESDRFKNCIIDEDKILKLFGIGYASVEKYGPGFNAQNVVDCFKELYDNEDLEQITYDQILATAKRSVPYSLVSHAAIYTDIRRFGKDESGVVLNHCIYSTDNSNYTVALIKLMFIEYSDVSSLSAKHIFIEPGKKLTKSELPFCESMIAYKNGNLKIKFATKERADQLCKLLLGDDNDTN